MFFKDKLIKTTENTSFYRNMFDPVIKNFFIAIE